MWRCIEDIFSYCSEEPVWTVKPSELMLGTGFYSFATGAVIAGKCQNSPNSCPHHRSHSAITEALLRKPKRSRKRKPKTREPQAATPAPVAL